MYDITNRETFDECKKDFIEDMKRLCKNEQKVILLGNKSDLQDERKVTFEEGKEFAELNGFEFMEVSVAQNKNIKESVEIAIAMAIENRKKQILLKEKEKEIENKFRKKNNNNDCHLI